MTGRTDPEDEPKRQEHNGTMPDRALGQGVAARLLMLVLAFWPTAIAGTASAEDFETPPVLEAAEVLPAEMLRGNSFKVQEQVHNDGFMNYYVVDSDFGRFEAYGTPALAKLIQEIGALDQLDEISKSEVFVDAAKRSATSQVHAIEDFADKPVETVKGVPGGLKRSFKKYKRTATDGYETAKQATAQEDSGEDGGEPDSTSEDAKVAAGKAGDAAEVYAKKWFGVGKAERSWHQKLGTDPYTTNEALRKRVKELSKVDAATTTGMRFVPIPRVPGASELRAINQMVWSVDPRELREQNIKRLTDAGVDEGLIEQFMTNPWFSPTGQTLLLTALQEMEGVEGRQFLLEIAAATESAEEGQFDLGNIVFLSTYHRTVEPLAGIRAGRVADPPSQATATCSRSFRSTVPSGSGIWPVP